MRPMLWILDITNWAFRAIHAAPPLTSSAGIQTGGTYLFARMLLRFLAERRPTHLVAVWDAPARSFRKDLSPDYKANRTPLGDGVKHELKLTRAVVLALPLPVVQVAGVEADDVMATLALRARGEGFDATIVTADKDLMRMVGTGAEGPGDEGVRFYDPQKMQYFGPAEVQEKWGIPPALVSDLLALTGDSSDNVAGVPGIGPKTAATLLTQYGSLDGVIAHAAEVKGKRGQALRDTIASGQLDLARRLTALRTDVALPGTLEDLRLPPSDDQLRTALFTALEFYSLLPEDLSAGRATAPSFDAQGRRV